MTTFTFEDSTAVKSISLDAKWNVVFIIFVKCSDFTYMYETNNLSFFENMLKLTIEHSSSIGFFVNQMINNKIISPVL